MTLYLPLSIILLVLLFRNLIKLWFERRQKVIGSRFKAKLVLAFLALSVGPAALIFAIASNFINRSIEGWFKPQVERPLDQALAVAQTYYQNLESLSLRHARQLLPDVTLVDVDLVADLERIRRYRQERAVDRIDQNLPVVNVDGHSHIRPKTRRH